MTDCTQQQQMGGWWEDVLVKRCSFPIGPRNTWSNLAYVLTGLLVWNHGPAGKMFAILLTLLGLGSGLYHGFKTFFTDRLDNAGMYLVYGGLAVYAVAPNSHLTPALMAVVGAVLAWRFAFVPVPDDYENILMGVFIALVTLAVWLNGHSLLAITSLSLMVSAYGIWWMDRHKTFWWPKWGHAIWHMQTALATYILFMSR